MLIGLTIYLAMSVLLAVSPSIEILIGARFLQGVAGAFGVAVAMGMVRDLAAGAAAARLLSTMMLVTGLGPILAPMIGGQLLRLVDWRGVFWFLAVVALGLLATAYFAIPETLPADRRTTGGVRTALRSYRVLITDRIYVGYALTNGLMFGAVFGYIAAASFVYQGIYHLTPQAYGVAAGINALGMVAMTQVNGRLVSYFAPPPAADRRRGHRHPLRRGAARHRHHSSQQRVVDRGAAVRDGREHRPGDAQRDGDGPERLPEIRRHRRRSDGRQPVRARWRCDRSYGLGWQLYGDPDGWIHRRPDAVVVDRPTRPGPTPVRPCGGGCSTASIAAIRARDS
ncbi:MFS transporter [Fodinicola feengrottensis]|uniref:MFS transporter n=1 Tax=Fodinicola feengrottensis TaxID=435914 RepID=UPI0024414292|nr:MFS transporter [Fodinicola feengrottensis]